MSEQRKSESDHDKGKLGVRKDAAIEVDVRNALAKVGERAARKRFYRWQFLCCVLNFLAMRIKTGRFLYMISAGTVCTKPRWLPAAVLLRLHKLQAPIVGSFMGALGLAAVKSDSFVVRIIAAITTSLYHLIESSITNRHGEYPLLYNVWGMLLPGAYSEAFALGVAVNFVLSTGLAKLQVGGEAWMHPATMRTYLDIYRDSRSKPPISKTFNHWLAQRSWATGAIGIGTIMLECIGIPSTLLLAPPWRNIGSASMIALHLGIAYAMSGMVGFLFLTSIPSYLVGFNCRAQAGTKHWWLACLSACLPNIYSALVRRPLSESWPLTPAALFMWSGERADILCRSLMNGDTRVVMSTSAAPLDITNLPVTENGVLNANHRADHVVHDALTRVIGFTLAQGDLAQAAWSIKEARGSWEITSFLERLQSWLRQGRLLEIQSGGALTRAFFVRVMGGRVVEVLSTAS